MQTNVLRSFFMITLFTFMVPILFGQETPIKKITLKEILEIAKKGSLDAFKAKRRYGAEYWTYRSFQAKLQPKVNLELQPFTFNRSFIKRYDPINNIDVYREQQNLNTFAQLSVSQNIRATGAIIFINSSFNRLENFGDLNVENYNTTPLRIGLQQPLMAFNELKWGERTADMEYKRARKKFLTQQQDISLKGVSLFFQWALANTKAVILKENRKNAERLYSIGKKRYPLGSIEKDDLLNLELETFTAETELAKAQQELRTIVNELQLFLDMDNLSGYVPELPGVISHLKIDMEEAKEYAYRNNPELLDIEIRKIHAERNLDRAIKENRFDFSISASYGLNQQAESFADAYSNFLDQQLVAVQFSMPLLDWGERKGNIQTARMDKEVTDIQIEQDRNDIEQQLMQNIDNFNLQEKQVIVALKTRDIARESYHITEKRFLSGKVDLLRLLTARKSWQDASEGYVQSLHGYWGYYYEMQRMTLYNFMDDSTLEADFERLLDE